MHLLDAGTTQVGLSRGFREGVLPTQNPAAIWAIEGGAAATEIACYRTLRVQHPKLARVLGIGAIVTEGTFVAWNTRQLATRRR